MTDEDLAVDLVGGRTVSVPLSWYPRLAHGTPEGRCCGLMTTSDSTISALNYHLIDE